MILRDCNSPYILQYYGSYLKNSDLWIIIEYCDAGSVHDLMRTLDNSLNEEQIASIMQMVLLGLQFLHEKKKSTEMSKQAMFFLIEMVTLN